MIYIILFRKCVFDWKINYGLIVIIFKVFSYYFKRGCFIIIISSDDNSGVFYIGFCI